MMRYSIAIAVIVVLTLASAVTFRYQAARAAHNEVLLAQARVAVERAAGSAPALDTAQPQPATTPPVTVELAKDSKTELLPRQSTVIEYGLPAGAGMGAGGMAFQPTRSPDHELASQNQQLEQEVGSIVPQLADGNDEAQREVLKKKLIDSLEKQFDTQQKLRELEVAQIDARVQKLRELIRKRTESRRRIVDNRYEQLLNDAEGLGWSSTDGGAGVGSPRFAPAGLPGLAPTGIMPQPIGPATPAAR